MSEPRCWYRKVYCCSWHRMVVGRHGSVSSVQLGLRSRIRYMDITEEDLVLGSHMDRIPAVVEDILSCLPKRPPAFFICASCIDDLLASDYKNLCLRLTERYGLPFVDCHMNPITANSSMPPALNIQRSLYDFLCKEKNTRVRKTRSMWLDTFHLLIRTVSFSP